MPTGEKFATPMIRQYLSLKAEHPQAIVLYQLGDFYEMFRDDAVVASEILDLVLTSRRTGRRESVPMCGIPMRSASDYIRRLVKRGYSVALADQVEDASVAKGLVRREVVEVITPGTLTAEGHLGMDANWLLAIHGGKTAWGLASLEVSLGQAKLQQVPRSSGFDKVTEAIEKRVPAEVIISGKISVTEIARLRGRWRLGSTYPVPTKEIRPLERFLSPEKVEGMGLRGVTQSKVALAHALGFADRVGKWKKGLSLGVGIERDGDRMLIDRVTARQLGISGEAPSLVALCNKTQTAMGRRELTERLEAPLTSRERIEERWNRLEWLVERPLFCETVTSVLKGTPDLARAAWRVEAGRALPRDLVAIREALLRARKAHTLLNEQKAEGWEIEPPLKLLALLEEALPDNPDIEEFIRPSFDKVLAKWDRIKNEGVSWFRGYEQEEREKRQIPSLRVKHNRVFGWYIEITKTHLEKVPEGYIRKQTMANAERYFTEELKEREKELLLAEERWRAAQRSAFARLVLDVEKSARVLLELSDRLGGLDTEVSLAQVAEEGGWVRPILEEGSDFVAEESRHPVVEASLPMGDYVPNPFKMGPSRILGLVTGPNMAGKSTYIRTAGLLAVLAQAGAFVPANSFRFGVVDALFARIGSSDAIAEGRSTFLVEMSETAAILHQATKKSVVILDEIGRGTATYDGMAIAQAVAEHLAHLGCRTLFATHYHELCAMEEREGIFNLQMEVARQGPKIHFLHQVGEGRADRSYGIEVAKMAGFPPLVLRRAQEILDDLGHLSPAQDRPPAEPEPPAQQGLF